MKDLDVTPYTDSGEDLYAFFCQLFPEMVPDVEEWQVTRWDDEQRDIAVAFRNGLRLMLETMLPPNGAAPPIWVTYLVPSDVLLLPDRPAVDSPMTGVDLFRTRQELFELFGRLLPEYRDKAFGWENWRCFSDDFRGIRVHLEDGKDVLFGIFWDGLQWDARYPLLVPAREGLKGRGITDL